MNKVNANLSCFIKVSNFWFYRKIDIMVYLSGNKK